MTSAKAVSILQFFTTGPSLQPSANIGILSSTFSTKTSLKTGSCLLCCLDVSGVFGAASVSFLLFYFLPC